MGWVWMALGVVGYLVRGDSVRVSSFRHGCVGCVLSEYAPREHEHEHEHERDRVRGHGYGRHANGRDRDAHDQMP